MRELLELYQEAENKFNFGNTHMVMKSVGWKWVIENSTELQVPTIEEMKKTCKMLFNECISDLENENFDEAECSTGGFTVFVTNKEENTSVVISFGERDVEVK